MMKYLKFMFQNLKENKKPDTIIIVFHLSRLVTKIVSANSILAGNLVKIFIYIKKPVC